MHSAEFSAPSCNTSQRRGWGWGRRVTPPLKSDQMPFFLPASLLLPLRNFTQSHAGAARADIIREGAVDKRECGGGAQVCADADGWLFACVCASGRAGGALTNGSEGGVLWKLNPTALKTLAHLRLLQLQGRKIQSIRSV